MVVSVKGAVLVSSMDRVEKINEITLQLKSACRSESEIQREVSGRGELLTLRAEAAGTRLGKLVSRSELKRASHCVTIELNTGL